MGEHIQTYTQRIIANRDYNRNGVIELGDPLGITRPEVSGMDYDFFKRSAPFLGVIADPISIYGNVARNIDTNHDYQISVWEKLKALVKFGIL